MAMISISIAGEVQSPSACPKILGLSWVLMEFWGLFAVSANLANYAGISLAKFLCEGLSQEICNLVKHSNIRRYVKMHDVYINLYIYRYIYICIVCSVPVLAQVFT